jgi:hypothetical protein
LTFPQFDFAPGEETLVVEETLFVGDYVGDKVAGDEVVDASPVAGIQIGAEPVSRGRIRRTATIKGLQ